MITIACVLRTPVKDHPAKQKQYTELDVLKLKNGINRFLSIEHNFVCLTDQTLSIETIPLIGDTPGWWAKIELFRPNLFKNPVLYIDLDMIICGNLNNIVESCIGNSFMLLGDSKKGNMGSGIIYFEGDHSDLWNLYNQNPKKYQYQYAKKPRYGDQAFIEDHKKDFVAMNEVLNKKWFCPLKFDTIPNPESKILICIGKGNKLHLEEYNNHPWVLKYWKNL
jgi:hypothetical protein